MQRLFRAVACAVALTLALVAPASGAAGTGQLVAVVGGRLAALNADGSGLRTLAPLDAGQVSELAFAPDGNRLAFVRAGELSVLELATGRTQVLTTGSDPGWSADGTTIGFRRGLLTFRIPAAGGEATPAALALPAGTTDIAWAPNLEAVVAVAAGVLVGPGLLVPPIVAAGAPAWSPDGRAIAFAHPGGLSVVPAGGGAVTPLASGVADSPRWARDSSALVLAHGGELRIVAASGGPARTVLTAADRIGATDWQPCVPGVTAVCESVSPPRCTATAANVTTQADRAVDLPAPPCTDPAGRPLTLAVVNAPDHGSVAGLRYTPAPGYSGQDAVAYRVTNGVAESETFRVTVFVVPRPPAVPLVTTRPPVLVQGAPFLSARATPRLDRRRATVARLSCDQDCTLTVRLSARLRTRRTLSGPQVKRSLAGTRVASLRLRLPSRPAGRLATVWITGRVRNAAGDVRRVRVPVRLPR